MDLLEARNTLQKLKGEKSIIQRTLMDEEQKLKDIKRDLRRHEEAREIIREVGLKTQQQLQYRISDITSLALEAVFDDPYELKVEFIQRRNKTECDLFFQRGDGGELIDPLQASGGGAVDVAAFALRVASWSMSRPRSRNVLVLDEPMRFLSRDLQEKASLMIKELSEKLGIQFIIITHEDTLTLHANKVFEVVNQRGKSKII